MNDTAIKHCPFCPLEIETTVTVREGSTFRWRVAECDQCGARSGEVRMQTLGDGTVEEWYEQGDIKAIEVWNTRPAESLTHWLVYGERGVSSNTIVSYLMGSPPAPPGFHDHPYDPADLRRCLLLLEQVPDLMQIFPRMATCSPVWAALVKQWSELRALLDQEVPDWREPNVYGKAPLTRKLMKDIISEASK